MRLLALPIVLGAALFAANRSPRIAVAGISKATSYRAKADFQLTADPLSQEWKDVRGVAFEHGRYDPRTAGRREVSAQFLRRAAGTVPGSVSLDAPPFS